MIFNKLLKTESEVIKCIEESSINKKDLKITYMNQQCFNFYNADVEYKNLLDNNFTVFIDGIGIYATLKLFGYQDVQKFNATDLYYKLFQNFALNKSKLFLIGGNFSEDLINENAVQKKLNICGFQNGYFSSDEFQKIIDSIIQNSPDVIVIGMGVPIQEFIASKISESVKSKVVLCVGGFMEFYFGTKKRAPVLLRAVGLEWIHRLVSEPKRLWRRYLIGIPKFCLSIITLKFDLIRKNY